MFDEVGERKMVEWNRRAKGFQDSWLWQFGEGPFELSIERDVPSNPGYFGSGDNIIEFRSEPGKWYWIKLSETAHHYRKTEPVECKVAWFHSNWFLPSE